LRHGYMLGVTGTFFYKLVEAVEKEMGTAYPELTRERARVEKVLKQEEERFAETLSNGMVLLNRVIQDLSASKGAQIPGDTVFKLYDTYGFPVDLTADVARERGFGIDQAGFDALMEEQRKRAQQAGKFNVDLTGVSIDSRTLFQGYEGLDA